MDADGVDLVANSLALNGGKIAAVSDGGLAALGHAALAGGSGRTVNSPTAGGICDRTAAVQTAILARVRADENDASLQCGDIGPVRLVAIGGRLDLSAQARNGRMTALRAGDFAWLANVTGLDLDNHALRSFPAGDIRSADRAERTLDRLQPDPGGGPADEPAGGAVRRADEAHDAAPGAQRPGDAAGRHFREADEAHDADAARQSRQRGVPAGRGGRAGGRPRGGDGREGDAGAGMPAAPGAAMSSMRGARSRGRRWPCRRRMLRSRPSRRRHWPGRKNLAFELTVTGRGTSLTATDRVSVRIAAAAAVSSVVPASTPIDGDTYPPGRDDRDRGRLREAGDGDGDAAAGTVGGDEHAPGGLCPRFRDRSAGVRIHRGAGRCRQRRHRHRGGQPGARHWRDRGRHWHGGAARPPGAGGAGGPQGGRVADPCVQPDGRHLRAHGAGARWAAAGGPGPDRRHGARLRAGDRPRISAR